MKENKSKEGRQRGRKESKKKKVKIITRHKYKENLRHNAATVCNLLVDIS